MHQVFLDFSSKADFFSFCRLSISASCLHLLLACPVDNLLQAQGAEAHSEKLYIARQNPILREYFRKQAQNIGIPNRGRFSRNSRFIEGFVNRRIDHFMEEMHENIRLLKSNMAEVKHLNDLLISTRSPAEIETLYQPWHAALDGLEDEAKDLRNMLSYLFPQLRNRNKFKPQIDTKSRDNGFTREIRFLENQVMKAEKRITDYFLNAGTTIELNDLKTENMLICLNSIRLMAREMKQALD